MGIADADGFDWAASVAALEWQVDLGVTDFTLDAPINRYDLPDRNVDAFAPATKLAAPASPQAPPIAVRQVDPVAVARQMAGAAQTLDDLRAAMAAFDHCDLKKGARNLVFSDGDPKAKLMVIGEAPGRDEDYEGRPFVGAAGQLLDKMLAAIGFGRGHADPASAVYITNVLPWRPPGNRDPSAEEIAMLQPFLARHIELVAPRVIIATGNSSCSALLGQRGILRLRGQWLQTQGVPVMPMTHPAYLLGMPAAKREAWADLLAVQAKLKEDE
jgi:DNA polymerase